MPRTINVAAVQMDANPAPTADRLARADRLTRAAAEAGAQLVVLPELFNTGYAYAEANYRLAEPIDGPTVAWMKEVTARLNIHLAGSLMLLDENEVYNALLLFAPDGRFWRYDKNYPWGWERGYFREGHGTTIAQTELGDLGFMICWDTAHRDLWRRYAGQVDMMVISSCPPDVSNPTYHFPNGSQITFDDMGPLLASMKGSGALVFGDMLNQQTAWLGVPAVNTVGSGQIKTAIPNSFVSWLSILPFAPWLVKYLPLANQVQISCAMVPGCKLVNADGQPLAELTQQQGETFTLAEVTLADHKPSPQAVQPPARLPWLAYVSADFLLPWLTIPVYRQGLRRVWGRHMAPIDAASRRWLAVLGVIVLGSFLLGRRRRIRDTSNAHSGQ
jgi:hypothetical protein